MLASKDRSSHHGVTVKLSTLVNPKNEINLLAAPERLIQDALVMSLSGPQALLYAEIQVVLSQRLEDKVPLRKPVPQHARIGAREAPRTAGVPLRGLAASRTQESPLRHRCSHHRISRFLIRSHTWRGSILASRGAGTAKLLGRANRRTPLAMLSGGTRDGSPIA